MEDLSGFLGVPDIFRSLIRQSEFVVGFPKDNVTVYLLNDGSILYLSGGDKPKGKMIDPGVLDEARSKVVQDIRELVAGIGPAFEF